MSILLDGVPVWRISAEFYRVAPSTFALGTNLIGGSSCDSTFTGDILGIEYPVAAGVQSP
jgi:hypothetical protein